jgi:integrase
MTGQGKPGIDLAGLVVPLAGQLVTTGDRWEPYRLVDADGAAVDSARAYFGHLQAAGRAGLTVRSYGMDLLRWFRFLWAAGVAWDLATRAEGRDFCRWLQLAGKPVRPHWRERDRPGPAVPVPVSGEVYAPSVRAHSETVLRGFYDFHREAGTGPLINPFPLDRSRRGGRAHAHHNPMEPFHPERSGLYRPVVPSRIPRSVPDEEFNEIFAALHSHRDRALVAFYVSTGARASELLSANRAGADPGRQLITVVRKGTRELQQLPASADAFVWLRLYQLEMDGKLPRGSGQPLWWTLRRPFRPLGYHAVHRMFERAGAVAGTDATLHSLRHTAAYRMAEDPALPLTDVQLVLGHALLTTTQLYLTPRKQDVIRRILAHHARQVGQARQRARQAPAPGYRPESLAVLFGNRTS